MRNTVGINWVPRQPPLSQVQQHLFVQWHSLKMIFFPSLIIVIIIIIIIWGCGKMECGDYFCFLYQDCLGR